MEETIGTGKEEEGSKQMARRQEADKERRLRELGCDHFRCDRLTVEPRKGENRKARFNHLWLQAPSSKPRYFLIGPPLN